MPKHTTELLVGYGFNVSRTHQQIAADDGKPLFNGKGEPKTVEMTQIVFVDQAAGHTVIAMLTPEAKDELVRRLTGGVILADGNGGRL